jgi:hypothetical protein
MGASGTLAMAIGEAWASDLVRALHAEDREVIGAWPGTMREARRRLVTTMRTKLDPDHLEQLARVVRLAAQRRWQEVSQRDPER